MLLTLLVWAIISVDFVQAQTPAPADGDLRLAGTGSTASEGRVEIFHDNVWGTVCDDSFAAVDAIVVCRQLGFSPLGAKKAKTNRFGDGTGPIWLDELGCSGNEERLDVCIHGGWGVSDCQHGEDVGVVCTADPDGDITTPTPVTDTPIIVEPGICEAQTLLVRLKGPADVPGMGVVQVVKDEVWGGVCDNDWDIYDARVVCRMLCYDAAKALAGSTNFDTTNITEAMTIANVTCVGTESSIADCPQATWAENSCARTEMARVTCEDLNNAPPSRPDPLLECDGGMLTASFSLTRDPDLETKHLSVHLTYSGACDVVKTTTTDYVVIAVPFDQCGTQVTTNATHITYMTEIEYLPTSSQGNIGRANTYIVQVQCQIPRAVLPDLKPIVPLTEIVTQTAPGAFGITLTFYSDNGFETAVTEFPLQIPLGKFLNIGLYLGEVDSNLRLVVPSCYATPSSDRNDEIKYPLFTNKCQDDDTVGFFPFNDTAWGFRYQTFKFVRFSEVHIHCDAIVCRTEETDPECDRSCFPTTTTTTTPPITTAATNGGTGRRRRRSLNHDVIHVTSPAVYVYDPRVDNPSEIIRVPIEELTSQTAEITSPRTESNATSAWTVTDGVVFSKTDAPVTNTNPPGVPVLTEPPTYSRDDMLMLGDGSGARSLSQTMCSIVLAILLVAVLVL